MHLYTQFSIFVKTVSEANCADHWAKKYKRHKLQRLAVKSSLKNIAYVPQFPIHVRIIRNSRRFLDKHDNLPCSMKWIFDAICDYCRPGLAHGRADDTDQITVEYDQKKTKFYSVQIEIYHK